MGCEDEIGKTWVRPEAGVWQAVGWCLTVLLLLVRADGRRDSWEGRTVWDEDGMASRRLV